MSPTETLIQKEIDLRAEKCTVIDTIASILATINGTVEGAIGDLDAAFVNMDRAAAMRIDPTEACQYFEMLAKVLPQIVIINPNAAPSRPNLTPEVEEIVREQSKALEAVGASIIAGENEQFSKYGEVYGWFKPTLQFGALLKEVYKGECDPGAIIGDYLKLLFPPDLTKKCNSQDNGFIYSPHLKVEFGSKLHSLIVKIGSFLIDNLHLDPKVRQAVSVAFGHIMNPDEKDCDKYGVSMEEVSVAVLNTPADFFYTWLYVWYFDECCTPDITLAEFETVLLFYRLGEGNGPLFARHTDLVRHLAPATMYPKRGDTKEVSYEMLSKFFFAVRAQLGKCDEVLTRRLYSCHAA